MLGKPARVLLVVLVQGHRLEDMKLVQGLLLVVLLKPGKLDL